MFVPAVVLVAWVVRPLHSDFSHARTGGLACAFVERGAVQAAAHREALVDIRSAGSKGQGAFAGERLKAGTHVGLYVGILSTQEDIKQRYDDARHADYLFKLDDKWCIDAQNSSHFSRFFNHAEHGNLDVAVDTDLQQIEFTASRDIELGEEMTFDYGPNYWLFRPLPSPESDSRNFHDPIYRQDVPLALLHPPPAGTTLPLTPLTALELQAALALPHAEGRTALLRCLDYFGAQRTSDGGIELPIGIHAPVERVVLSRAALEAAPVETFDVLQRAAVACMEQAVLDPNDASGAASRGFRAWLDATDAEMALIRRWRERVPRFESARHDAAGLAAYLLWKCPGSHRTTHELTRDESNELIAIAAGQAADHDAEDVIEHVVRTLSQHAPQEHVIELIQLLEQWYTLGDGCTVVNKGGMPSLEGAVPQHLDQVWKRIPRLLDAGVLEY